MSINTIILLCSLAGSAFLTTSNRIAVALFCVLILSFNVLSKYIVPYNEYGFTYYIFAALVDGAIMYFLAKIIKPSEFTLKLFDACLLLVIVNALGFAFWWLYISSQLYTFLLMALYVYVLIITMIQGGSDRVLGNTAIHSRYHRIRRHYIPGLVTPSVFKKEARN